MKEKQKNEKPLPPPKPKYNLAQNVGFMVRSAWKYKEKKIIFLCLSLVILQVSERLVNLFILPAILSAVERGAAVPVMICTILGFVGATMLIRGLNTYVDENIQFGKITLRLHFVLALSKKSATMSYCNFLDPKFLDARMTGRQTLDNNNSAAEAMWGNLVSLLVAALGLIIYVAMMTALQPMLLIVVVVTALVNYFVSRYTNAYHHRHKEEQAEIGRRFGYSSSRVFAPEYGKDTRVFGWRPMMDELYRKSRNEQIAYNRRANAVGLCGTATHILTEFLRNGLAYVYLIGMVLGGGMSVAEFILYFGVVSSFQEHISSILGQLTTLHVQTREISYLREALDYPETYTFEEGKPLFFDPTKPHTITLENVSFTYPGAETPTLEHIDLTLHPGEKIAIVGLNGAGKTTLVNILCGFLDPTEGRVLLDGEDIRDYNRRDYYALFSAVFQNIRQLAGSIALNISQDPDHMDMERVKACAELAGFAGKVNSLPAGYETRLLRHVYYDATELSGGELQKLALARALYKDAPFLILDEPTAALDPIAEANMYLRYHEMTRGHAAVYISHRLASTRFCDRILLIDGKRIAEEGTHESLLAAGGKYAELFAVQSKYYREGVSGHA